MVSIFCIIGAGISGLVSAKYCLEKGYRVIILDKNPGIGGVWLSSSYKNVKLQTTKYTYAFSDFPHFKNTSLYPNKTELINYFTEYSNKHNLLKFCKFNTKVISTKFNKEKNKWIIKYVDQNNQNVNQNNQNYITVDYLIIASGFYTKKIIPNIICENSKKIVHSKELSDLGTIKPKTMKNKDIVVIGNGPTGCDLSTLAVTLGAKSVKLLYRSNRWLFKRLLWNVYGTDKFLSRFVMKLGNNVPTFLYIVFMITFYYIYYLFLHGIYTLKIIPPFKPITRQNLVLNEDIVNYIYQEKIQYKKCKNIKIFKNNIVHDNEIINYDLCILATGYKSEIEFLNLKKIPLLYKRIIHPNLSNCCFIGFAASFNWVQVSELQIQWYLNYINGKQVSKKSMINEISNTLENLSSKAFDYHDLSILAFDYCDSLANDIGIKCKYSKYSYNYWFKPPENDLWSINN